MIKVFHSKKWLITLALSGVLVFASAQPKEKTDAKKPTIGFLVHDLVSERWKKDMDLFERKVTEFGGEPVSKCAYGDLKTQIAQGKELVDAGVKVIAVVAVDGNALAELVDYADKAGTKIIAYDRLIKNCNLHYYVSYNSERVGILMTQYVVRLKPKGNYAIVGGPATDNNASLIKQGQMSVLKPYIDRGDIKIVLDKPAEAWGPLEAMSVMNDFLEQYQGKLDVVLVASDGLSEGVIEALEASGKHKGALVTGQDASLTACRNIVQGSQTMTIYKSIDQIATEAASLAMNIATNKKIAITTTFNNGKREVPCILFEPVVIDKNNMKETVIKNGHIKETDL